MQVFGKHVISNFLTLDEWNNYDWLNNYQNSFFNVNVEVNVTSGYLLMGAWVMQIFILIITILIFLKTMSYGVFEWKENKNISGGANVIILSIVTFCFVNFVMYIR